MNVNKHQILSSDEEHLLESCCQGINENNQMFIIK